MPAASQPRFLLSKNASLVQGGGGFQGVDRLPIRCDLLQQDWASHEFRVEVQ
jgi:hypothetical protein